MKNRRKLFFLGRGATPDAFQSIGPKPLVATKKDSIQSLYSARRKKSEVLKMWTPKISILGRISSFHAAAGGIRGHDFKVLAGIFDRNLILVLGGVSPTCTHSGRLLDIISNVFGVRDT